MNHSNEGTAKREPNYFEQTEDKITSVTSRMHEAISNISHCTDKLQGEEPADKESGDEAVSVETIFQRIGLAITRLEEATFRLEGESNRLRRIFD